MCPKKAAYFLAKKEYVGRIPIRQDLTILEANDPKALRIGSIIFENIGVAVISDYSISKLLIEDDWL